MPRRKSTTEKFEELAAKPSPEKYVLKLFVAGATPKSLRAVENVRRLCDELLPGLYELEIVDVYEQPGLLVAEQILAAPTLLKKLPHPVRKLIGDLSSDARVIAGLGLSDKPEE